MAVELRLGSRGGEHLSIDVLRREFSAETDYWDGNWLVAIVAVSAGRFQGRTTATLRADELRRFNDELKLVHRDLAARAVLESLEDWIQVEITGDDRGQLRVTGRMRDEAGSGNVLHFQLPAHDPAALVGWMDALDAIGAAFPVVGEPDAAP